jgi:hypothetical protein
MSIDQIQYQERKRRRNEKKRKRKRDRKAEYKRLLARRLKRIAELLERWKTQPPAPDERLDETAACLYVGGSKPIDPSTLRRRYSPPIKVGPHSVRWPCRNLEADIARMNAERDIQTAQTQAKHEDLRF